MNLNIQHIQPTKATNARDLFKGGLRCSPMKMMNRQCNDRFKCTIYYFYLTGLHHIKLPMNENSKIRFILNRARVPLYNVLDISYPFSTTEHNSLNTAILYFSSRNAKNRTKSKITTYLHQHFANHIKLHY